MSHKNRNTKTFEKCHGLQLPHTPYVDICVLQLFRCATFCACVRLSIHSDTSSISAYTFATIDYHWDNGFIHYHFMKEPLNNYFLLYNRFYWFAYACKKNGAFICFNFFAFDSCTISKWVLNVCTFTFFTFAINFNKWKVYCLSYFQIKNISIFSKML